MEVEADESGTTPVSRHPAAIRWMHWANLVLFVIMLWSGLRIYWADDVRALGILGWEWFRFFPDGFYETLDLNQRLARGIAYHLTFGWLFVLNGLAYVLYLAGSGMWRRLRPSRSELLGVPSHVAGDLHLRPAEPDPGDRYNGPQKLAYLFVLVVGGLLVASGFAIYKPAQLSWLTALLGGYETARLTHFVTALLVVVFTLVHVVQVVRAGAGNLVSMVVGVRKVPRSESLAVPELSTHEALVRTRRSLLTGGAGALAGMFGWRWVQTQRLDDRIPGVIRGGLEFNEAVWTAAGDPNRLVPEYPLSRARPLRINGIVGMRQPIDLDAWTLRVEGEDGIPLDELTLEQVLAFGTVDKVMRHKCIEGWSTVTHWTGVPFFVFADRYGRAARADYVSFETVGGGYYVGLDSSAARHPQVLLGTGLDGAPLDLAHGAPLRLVSPIHYGIKSIKRIGTIRFTNRRPADYWAERGYDWHSQF